MRRSIAVVVVLTLLVAACSSDSDTGALDADLEPIAAAARGKTNPGGLVLGVQLADGRAATAAIGDAGEGVSLTTTDRFHVGSITKTMTATLLLLLVDNGVVGLDDPARTYLPEDNIDERITLRHLAGMTAGVRDFVDDPGFNAAVSRDPKKVWEPSELFRYSSAAHANFEPGSSFEYSGTNTVLLGLVLEAATGTKLAEALEAEIFGPLGMVDTYLPTGGSGDAGSVTSYRDDFGSVTPALPGSLVSWETAMGAAGGAVSTVPDLLRFVAALFGGELLEPATLAEMLTFAESSPELDGYGLGVMRVHEPEGAYGHLGGFPGASAVALYHPETGASVVILSNRGGAEFRWQVNSTIDLVVEASRD